MRRALWIALCVLAWWLPRPALAQCTPPNNLCTGDNCGWINDTCGGAVSCSCSTVPRNCVQDPRINNGQSGECCAPSGAGCASDNDCGRTCVSERCNQGACCIKITEKAACGAAGACGSVSDGCGSGYWCATCPSVSVPQPLYAGQSIQFKLINGPPNTRVTGYWTVNGVVYANQGFGLTDATGILQYGPFSLDQVAPISASNVGAWKLTATVGAFPPATATFSVTAPPAPATGRPALAALTFALALGGAFAVTRRRRA